MSAESNSNLPDLTRIEGVDLFCGAGGLSFGLAAQGVRVVAGIDVDPACQYPYEANHEGAKFLLRDITTVSGEELNKLWSPGALRLLAGCAPCQPFSSYANTATVDKAKWRLLREFARLVDESRPDLVTMENVPRLQQEQPFKDFLRVLKKGGYQVAYAVLNAADYGAPQQRKRLVLVASRLGPVAVPEPTHKGSDNWVTVRQAVGHLKKLTDGQASKADPLHIASALSDLNRARIRASKPGGTWRDWPQQLVAACHQRESGKHSSGVYGRMEWDKPAPTMTTLCNGYGNGRFGHPEQHRGISLREAAIFQSFPETYRFAREGEAVTVKTVARLIGNAVPPKLGEAVARALYAAAATAGAARAGG
ncbi:DNA cytosine methyltransferase [Xylophilus ampelinus]|uniref:DNA (cytosine-5-)-methyltransferase n=1 Tax=Xylophilus ampelinus TaxID=54067 RepID=A0A318SFB0_9BURK|nr:DNA cytosine methyltransferase [Xylophilus ampelinus]MCS4510804.1 DNA cytosine methyltransferase [Xylophilus ampelinus]PYE76216.1 DNA (cytosine-5)-methyltransferase 1 [Xylophilus ampelinus]